MAKKSLLSKFNQPVHLSLPVVLISLLAIGCIVWLLLRFYQFYQYPTTPPSLQNYVQPTPIQYQKAHITYIPTMTLIPTPTLVPLNLPHGTISIPPADWLSNSYQYYDSNLDATINVPNGWSIVNDPSAAGEIPQPIGQWCFPSLKNYFKDFSQCSSTVPYGLKITPNDPTNKRSFLVLMSVGNGFGGSCNESIETGRMVLFDANITINNHAYVVTTARTTSAISVSPNAGVHMDCFYWPRIYETGQKSVWAMFNVRHWADSDATFITEMQILENMKFH